MKNFNKNLSESKIQQECVKWFRTNFKDILIFSIPNGAFLKNSNNENYTNYKNSTFPYQRQKKTVNLQAMRLIREGLTPGIPDLFIATSNNIYNGLFIEMKSEKGKVSEKQEKIHEKLKNKGYFVAVCKNVDEFKNVVNEYFNRE